MKRNVRGTMLAILSFALLLAGLAPAAHASTCSTATVAGDWGFTLTGTLLPSTGPVPAAATGQASADTDGKISATEARNVGAAMPTRPAQGSGPYDLTAPVC
jgi:hypothetical protein